METKYKIWYVYMPQRCELIPKRKHMIVERYEVVCTALSYDEVLLVPSSEYWEVFKDTPYPTREEEDQIERIHGIRYLHVFHRDNTLIVVPRQESIEDDKEEYEAPIRLLRTLIAIQAQERASLTKALAVADMPELEELLYENDIIVDDIEMDGTFSLVGLEVLANEIAKLEEGLVEKFTKNFQATDIIGPKLPYDALCDKIASILNKAENFYLVDLLAFGERGLYLTPLANVVEQKMDQFSCNYDEVVHILSEWYLDTLDIFILDEMDSQLGEAPRASLVYAGILSPKYYNYKTDEVIVTGGALSVLHKTLMVSKHSLRWAEYVRVHTTETDTYVPFYERKEFDKHISRWSNAQKGCLLSFYALLGDEEEIFNDVDGEFDEQVTKNHA